MRRRIAIGIWLSLVAAVSVARGEPSWQKAGLDERQAAAHVLNRLTYGPRPGDLERVLELGIERWLALQLAAGLDDERLERRLAGLPGADLSAAAVAATYPPAGQFLNEARQAGVLPEGFDPRLLRADPSGSADLRRGLVRFARERGYRPQRELLVTLMTQKLERALHAENQLVEVLTDFWFNHFNVALSDRQCRIYVLAYERDAIRPHVLGRFRTMLGATARHPAMLLYLDNALSTAAEDDRTTLDEFMSLRGLDGRRLRRGAGRRRPDRPQGLNENYARELLELHTLGVDGGYGQEDVIAAARAFTGWTVLPGGPRRQRLDGRLQRALASGAGFVAEDGFLFRADAHDAGPKRVLGRHMPAGRGIEDGEEVLDLAAAHGSTGRHLARKLAARFVADEPPPALVERLARVYRDTGGDLRWMMTSLVESEEFWSPQAVGQKMKSPLELAVSALRALDGEVRDPRQLVDWIARMGQPLYDHLAPTGYPDRAAHWVSTGSLLNRMNFGLALAGGRIEGVRLELLAVAGGREPESRSAALETYLQLLLPERDLSSSFERLGALVGAEDLAGRVERGAPPSAARSALAEAAAGDPLAAAPTALEQVVGIILGSPVFQRR